MGGESDAQARVARCITGRIVNRMLLRRRGSRPWTLSRADSRPSGIAMQWQVCAIAAIRRWLGEPGKSTRSARSWPVPVRKQSAQERPFQVQAARLASGSTLGRSRLAMRPTLKNSPQPRGCKICKFYDILNQREICGRVIGDIQFYRLSLPNYAGHAGYSGYTEKGACNHAVAEFEI